MSYRLPIGPVLSLGLIVAVASGFMAFLGYNAASPTGSSVFLYNIAFAFCVAWFVESDRRVRGIHAPFEHGAFIFFLWPVALPFYMFRTRRWWGVVLALGLVACS